MNLPLDDRGLLLGDGLFETVLGVDGRAQHLNRHLDRMAAGCETLGLPRLDRLAAARAVETAAASLPHGRAAVRLTLTAGSGGRGLDRPESPAVRLFAAAAPAPRPTGPARLVAVATRRNEGSPVSRLKTLSYLDSVLARAQARALGADEALMLNNRGEIACAAAANLFWIAGGRLFTPALDCGILAGTMRERVLEAAGRLGLETAQVRAPAAGLAKAEAMFLTNALIGVRPVSHFAGGSLADSPLVAELARNLSA